MFKRVLVTLIICVFAIGGLRLQQQINELPVIQQQVNLPSRIKQVINSVVHVVNETQGWQGSGVAVTKDIILTARHVVEGGDEFTITLNNGKQLKATQAISSKKYDLGFIKISEPILEFARLGTIKGCKLGQEVFTIGSPYGKENFNSVTLGIISGLGRGYDLTDWEGNDYGWSVIFSTDAAGHPGNSGCPVFTMDGKVRGILVGGLSPVLIYCVPVDLVAKDLLLIDIMFTLNDYFFEEAQYYNDEWDG